MGIIGAHRSYNRKKRRDCTRGVPDFLSIDWSREGSLWKNQPPLAFSICCRQGKFLLFQGHLISLLSYLFTINRRFFRVVSFLSAQCITDCYRRRISERCTPQSQGMIGKTGDLGYCPLVCVDLSVRDSARQVYIIADARSLLPFSLKEICRSTPFLTFFI
jgi:hypothetical protein